MEEDIDYPEAPNFKRGIHGMFPREKCSPFRNRPNTRSWVHSPAASGKRCATGE